MTYCSKLLNTIGLGLVFAGCVLLYKFGLAPDFSPEGKSRLLLENEDQAEIAKGDLYRIWGRVGIGLIAVGSLFQIWATWV